MALDEALLTRLEIYYRLLSRWNTKINLTALPLEDLTDHAVDRLLIEPLAAAASILTFRARADRSADMGAVSHQWITEHRLGTNQDPRR